MRPSPALVELMVELHQLGASDRRAILARLEPIERQRIEGHLQKLTALTEPSFDALATLSPWLAECLAEARSGADGRLTHATREALADAERLLPRDQPVPKSSLSLIDRFLGKGRKQ